MKRLAYPVLIICISGFLFFILSQETENSTQVMASSTQEVKVKTDKTVLEILKIQFPKFFEIITKSGAAPFIEKLTDFTVFAPSDKAFEDLEALIGKSGYHNLFGRNVETTEDAERLQKIINFHIIPLKVTAPAPNQEKEVVTLNGRKLKIKTQNNQVTVNNDNTVVEADIVGANGIVHQINNVILE